MADPKWDDGSTLAKMTKEYVLTLKTQAECAVAY